MTGHEKLEAEELKKRIYFQRGGMCEVCGVGPIPLIGSQLAHRICKSKPNLKKYGKEIIHHPKNLVLTCSKQFGICNSSVNIGMNPEKVKALVKEIEDE